MLWFLLANVFGAHDVMLVLLQHGRSAWMDLESVSLLQAVAQQLGMNWVKTRLPLQTNH